MNRVEAKLILEVSRPGDEAAADPQLAAALALAQTDPELDAWLARERAWDAAIRRELRTVPVPADLKASLLAGSKVVPLPPAESRPSFTAWLTPLVWAMAAALILFAGLASYRSLHAAGKNSQLADFARDMIAASPDDSHHVDVMNADFSQVKSWLPDHELARPASLHALLHDVRFAPCGFVRDPGCQRGGCPRLRPASVCQRQPKRHRRLAGR